MKRGVTFWLIIVFCCASFALLVWLFSEITMSLRGPHLEVIGELLVSESRNVSAVVVRNGGMETYSGQACLYADGRLVGCVPVTVKPKEDVTLFFPAPPKDAKEALIHFQDYGGFSLTITRIRT